MSDTYTAPPTAKVTESTFIGVLWAGTGISLVFLLFRLYVKVKSFRKLYSDDFMVILAWVMLLATAIFWQIEVSVLYEQYAVNLGLKPPTPAFIERELTLLHCFVPVTILFYSCLWSIKLSFLLFFRRLISKVRGQQIWWWCVTTVTVLTWAASIGDIHYKCLLGDIVTISTYCQTLSAIRYDNRTFYANCASDVVTDCLIITIPVILLWNARVPMRQKLLLIGIFSLVVVTMIISIIRVAIVNSVSQNADVSWLYLWSNVEMTTSIIIACIASFRQLFTNLARSEHGRGAAGQLSPRRLLTYLWTRARSLVGSQRRWPSSRLDNDGASGESDSKVPIAPLKSIHVSHNISIPYLSRRDREEEQDVGVYSLHEQPRNGVMAVGKGLGR